MKFRTTLLSVCAFALVCAPASAADRESVDRVVAATGVAHLADGKATVEVLVAVRAGQSAREQTRAALAGQGAKPVADEYSFTGLFWDVLPVVQNYNPAGEPIPAAQLLWNTHSPWSTVSGSRYGFSRGSITNRCPSLVRECPGKQVNDRLNDVGWAKLSGRNTLGVTWSTSGLDEADMAINTAFRWHAGCTNVANSFDLQTVFLHENGHVAGLDHSTDRGAVMYPSYQSARCSLGADDQAGIRALYPA